MISGISAGMNYNNSVNFQEMRQKQSEMFNKIDSDGNGSLDKSEFQVLSDKMAKKTGHSINVDEVFSTFDSDSDGLISKEEHSFMRPPAEKLDMIGGGMPMGGMMGMNKSGNASSRGDNSVEEDDETVDLSLDTNGDGVVDAQDLFSDNSVKLGSYKNNLMNLFSQSNQNSLSLNIQA